MRSRIVAIAYDLSQLSIATRYVYISKVYITILDNILSIAIYNYYTMYRNYTRSQLLEFRVSLLYNDISKETYIRYVYRYISKETYITIVAIDPDRGAVGPICSEDRGQSAEGRTRRPRVLYLQLWHPPSRLLSLITGTARRQRATAVSDHDRARTLYSRPQGDQVADTQGP